MWKDTETRVEQARKIGLPMVRQVRVPSESGTIDE
jgi:hypothetical protein